MVMDLKDPRTAGNAGRSSGAISDDLYFVGSISPMTGPLERVIVEIAPTDIPVLILGESGSGKEVVAQRIHRLSRHRNEPLAKLMCANLSVKDLDALLAGEKTVGIGERLSHAGTVLFDEVGDLEQACQPKLLHALHDGDTLPQDNWIRARVISSSARNLEEEIRCGRFREELYYRLNGVCLRLPPLRRRKEDIPALVDFFVTKHAEELERPKPYFSTNAMRKLLDYHWPGNIRQLENAVRNIVALGDEGLVLGDLELLGRDRGSPVRVPETFSLKEAGRAASQQAERELILKALQRTRWNRKRAALELRISYKALLYKLKQIGMEDSAESSDSHGRNL